MTDLKIDAEFRDLIPPLTDDERKQLEENLLRDGIQDPLKTWQGIVVDGHNRYEIAQRHALDFATVELHFDSRDDAKIWIIKNQFGRRNLSAYDRSILALKLKPVIAAKAKEQQGTRTDLTSVRNLTNVDTKKEIAKAAGVSHDTIAKVERIEQQASPEIKSALRTGDLSINAAYQKIKQAEKSARQEERRERKAYTPPTELPADIKLIRADIRDGLAEIADNSVDIIITDPPYPKEYLPLYADLSKVAARVLKDGGSLICMTGQSYLPDVIQLLAAELNYQWCLCYLTAGAKTQIWARHVQTVWKPLLWFVKGNHVGDWLGVDAVLSDRKDKHFHDWGQSFNGIKGIIECFTNPADVVLDPFLGGGTTAVAAVTSGRKFIGADIEQTCIDTTKIRITEEFPDGNRSDNA